MNINETSWRFTGAIGMIIALVAVLFGVAPAHAEPDQYTIEIHKFEQPEVLGSSATGLPLDTTGLTPVPDATFTAVRVPGVDTRRNDRRQQVASMSIAEASALTAGEPLAAEVTTDHLGNARMSGLQAGLYLVRETFAPAGYVASTPFIVSLPLTDPVNRDRWLDTVHVYPKNAYASITLDVIDQDAVVLGDAVTWTSRSTIPNLPHLDGYRVDQVIDPRLEYTGHITVGFDCDCGALVLELDYTVSFDGATNIVTVQLTESGLRKLERAVAQNPHTNVVIDYETTVLAEGILVNESILYPSHDAIDHRRGVHDTAVTKWGPLSVIVDERGNPLNLIADACFNVYASESDALARTNPITVDGVSEWVTGSDGRFIVPGLRFSDFANGLDRAEDDPLYRSYWAVPVCVPEGWEWFDDRPLSGIVNDTVEYQTLIFQVVRRSPGLPVTGGQLAGLGILGAVLIGGGLLAVLTRRRNSASGVADS